MNAKTVYTTEKGRMCPECGRQVSGCVCSAAKPSSKGEGRVRVSRETKGRKGKGVTVITGLPLAMEDLARLAKELKQKCGTGGTIKDGTIELQGDHRDTVVEELIKKGFQAKRSGG